MPRAPAPSGPPRRPIGRRPTPPTSRCWAAPIHRSVPPPGVRTRVILFARDCAAMWPVLEDAVWAGGRGALDGGAIPFLMTESAVAEDGFTVRWALDGAATGHFHYLAPPEVWDHNGG